MLLFTVVQIWRESNCGFICIVSIVQALRKTARRAKPWIDLVDLYRNLVLEGLIPRRLTLSRFLVLLPPRIEDKRTKAQRYFYFNKDTKR